MRNKNRRNNFQKQTPIQTCITVTADECRGDAEKMVRKFCKKIKRSGILDEVRERRFYKKPSVTAAERRAAKKRLIAKVNRKRDELFSFSAGRTTKRR
jgi:ribosomal protein S21